LFRNHADEKDSAINAVVMAGLIPFSVSIPNSVINVVE
jgi:hypothetical protein